MRKEDETVICEHCDGRPAACYGAYESEESVGFACGECCGHGNEDGWCFQLSQIPELIEKKNSLFIERNELKARVAALEEQLKINADFQRTIEMQEPEEPSDDTVH